LLLLVAVGVAQEVITVVLVVVVLVALEQVRV